MKNRIYVLVAVDVEVPEGVDDTEAVPEAIQEADYSFKYEGEDGVKITDTEILGTSEEYPEGF